MPPQGVPVAEDEDDPIVASYNVFVQPRLREQRQLLVFQHPNRQSTREKPPPATHVRLKRNTGMAEVDMPTDLSKAYDRRKGQEWGTALRRSMDAKSGGSHGLAGGFAVGAPPPRMRRGEDKEDVLMDWNEASRTDRVLRTAVHGGMAPAREEADPMVGVFHGNNLYLSPASTIISLRPQMHHLDALAETERRREAAAASAEKGAPGATSGGRAVHMTIKSDNSNQATTETMTDRLRAIQGDKWVHLAYVNENQPEAWDSYNSNLVLRPEENPGGPLPQLDEEDADGKVSSKKGKSVAARPDMDTISGASERRRAPSSHSMDEDEVKEIKVGSPNNY